LVWIVRQETHVVRYRTFMGKDLPVQMLLMICTFEIDLFGY